MKRKHNKGQSILEYTLLLAAVIGVIVYVLLGSGGIKSKIINAYNATGDALNTTTTGLTAGVFNSTP